MNFNLFFLNLKFYSLDLLDVDTTLIYAKLILQILLFCSLDFQVRIQVSLEEQKVLSKNDHLRVNQNLIQNS